MGAAEASRRGVRIAGSCALPAAKSAWAEDWCTVDLRAGHPVHAVTFAADPALPGVSVPQRRVRNRLASPLAFRWLDRLGQNWH